MIAKYLATSLAMENVVSEPRVISSCLATSTTSISLVGLESRSTMVPASLAACAALFSSDESELVLGGGLGQEVVDADLGRDGLGRERVVAGDHHGADAHVAQVREPLGHALLDRVLEVDDAEPRAVVGHHQRRPAVAGDGLDDGVEVGRDGAAG